MALLFKPSSNPTERKATGSRVDRKLSKAAGADAGDIVTLEIAPAGKDTEPEVPTDLKKALAAAAPKTRTVWSDITPNARRDWIHWITSAKQEETRARRIKNACSMLACREATRLLLRPVRVLQQKHERSQSGDLDEYQFLALTAKIHRLTLLVLFLAS